MSIELTSLSFGQTDLTPSEKHILTILCFRAHKKTYECWSSVQRLMSDSGYSENTVTRILKSLRDKNKIINTGKKKGETKSIPVYKINIISTPMGGGVNKLSTPMEEVSTPMEGVTKHPHGGDIERHIIKDKRKRRFSCSNGPKEIKNIFNILNKKEF